MSFPSPSDLNMSKGLGELFIYLNETTSGWLTNLVMLGIYVMFIIGYYKAKDDFGGAMAIAGFGTFVVALLFWLGGILSGVTLAISVALALVGFIVIASDKHQS